MFCKNDLSEKQLEEKTKCSSDSCDRLVCITCKEGTNFNWIIQEDEGDDDCQKYLCKECEDKRVHVDSS